MILKMFLVISCIAAMFTVVMTLKSKRYDYEKERKFRNSIDYDSLEDMDFTEAQQSKLDKVIETVKPIYQPFRKKSIEKSFDLNFKEVKTTVQNLMFFIEYCNSLCLRNVTSKYRDLYLSTGKAEDILLHLTEDEYNALYKFVQTCPDSLKFKIPDYFTSVEKRYVFHWVLCDNIMPLTMEKQERMDIFVDSFMGSIFKGKDITTIKYVTNFLVLLDLDTIGVYFSPRIATYLLMNILRINDLSESDLIDMKLFKKFIKCVQQEVFIELRTRGGRTVRLSREPIVLRLAIERCLKERVEGSGYDKRFLDALKTASDAEKAREFKEQKIFKEGYTYVETSGSEKKGYEVENFERVVERHKHDDKSKSFEDIERKPKEEFETEELELDNRYKVEELNNDEEENDNILNDSYKVERSRSSSFI